MADFWTAYDRHVESCEPVLAWLNTNTGFAEWYVWHTGGGCTCYAVETEMFGLKGTLVLANDSCAEPYFSNADHACPWLLQFEYDTPEHGLDQYVLSQTQYDLRDSFRMQNPPELMPV